jgi:hypothetical protein
LALWPISDCCHCRRAAARRVGHLVSGSHLFSGSLWVVTYFQVAVKAWSVICFPDRRKSIHGGSGRPGETFCAFAIVHRAESRWFADPWQTPLDVSVSPCFARSRKQMERFTCGARHNLDVRYLSLSLHKRRGPEGPLRSRQLSLFAVTAVTFIGIGW